MTVHTPCIPCAQKRAHHRADRMHAPVQACTPLVKESARTVAGKCSAGCAGSSHPAPHAQSASPAFDQSLSALECSLSTTGRSSNHAA